MSNCDEFTQNAWRRDLCRNCLRPKSEHNIVSDEKKPNKSPGTPKGSGKENSLSGQNCDKNTAKSETKSRPKNGVTNESKGVKTVTNRVATKSEVGTVKVRTTGADKKIDGIKNSPKVEVKNAPVLGVKNSPKLGAKSSSNLDVKNSVKTNTGRAQNPSSKAKKSALKKDNSKKRRTSGVTFFVGVDYVIGENGGLNGSDSEEQVNDVDDVDDTKPAPQSKEEKLLAKITFDNTDFNSDAENLKVAKPVSPDSSLVRSRSIGSQEYLEIEDALLWHPKKFTNYVKPENQESLLTRKSPPPQSSDTHFVIPDIDIGEKTPDAVSKSNSTDKVNEKRDVSAKPQNDSVFKLSGMQPRMNLAQPYKSNCISPSTIVLPFPAADSKGVDANAYDSLTSTADTGANDNLPKGSATKNSSLREAFLFGTTAEQTVKDIKPKETSEKKEEPKTVTKKSDKNSDVSKDKSVKAKTDPKSKEKLTKKNSSDKSLSDISKGKTVPRQSSISGSSTSSNSPRNSPKLSSTHKVGQKGARVNTPSSGATKTTGARTRSGSLPAVSTKPGKPDSTRKLSAPPKVEKKDSTPKNLVSNAKSVTKQPDTVSKTTRESVSSVPVSDLGNSGKSNIDSTLTRRQSEPVLGLTSQNPGIKLENLGLDSLTEELKSPSTLKRKSIKRPAPAPPPPPPSTVTTTHPPILRSASVPTPPSGQEQKQLEAMATRTMSVDAGDSTPRSTKSVSSNSDTGSTRSNNETPKRNKLSSSSFLKKFLPKKTPKDKDAKESETKAESAPGFSPNWVNTQEIEFMDDSFSDGSFDDDLVQSVDYKHDNSNAQSVNAPGNDSSDWNHIFKNFGKSDLEVPKYHSDGGTLSRENSNANQKQPSDVSAEGSPNGSLSNRKSSFETSKPESPQKKWATDKIETLRKSRDISGPILLDGTTRGSRPVSVAVRPTVNESERSPRPRSLEKSPMHEGRSPMRRDQKPIKKPPAPPPPIPAAALQKRAAEEGSAGSVKSTDSGGSGKRVPIETMTLDRKSTKSRASPRPTSTGDQIARPKPPPPPPPSTLPRSRSSPDKTPQPKRPPPPKFKPQNHDGSPKPESHVYEEYGTRHVRGSKAPAPTARHQYEYIFDKPGKGRQRDNVPENLPVKPHEIGMAYEPVSVSPEHPEAKPLTDKARPVPKKRTEVNAVPKPKRSHLYEVIHPEDRDSDSGCDKKRPPNSPPYNSRYEAVEHSSRHRHNNGMGDEDIYDVVEVPPIPVNPPESPTFSRSSRSFEDYLVPIRRGSIDALEGSGTDDEIEEDTLGSLPDLPTSSDICLNADDKKKEGESIGLLESVLQKLKEPKKGKKEGKSHKKMFSTKSLTRRPRSSRHNSLPDGVNIVLLKQDSDKACAGSLKSSSTGTGSIRSATGSMRSTGSMEEYVDMSGASGKEDDPSPSSTGSTGEAGNSPMLPRSKPATPSVRGRTCLPPPPTLTRGHVDLDEANITEMFANIANMNLQTLNQVLRDMEVPNKSKNQDAALSWESFVLESEVPLMRSAALAFYKASLKSNMESLVLMISFDKVPDELSSKFHCNGLKQRCCFEDEIPCQFHPDSILQQIVGANMGTALMSRCQITVLEYTNVATLDKYLEKFIDDTDIYFREVCFILVQLFQYTIYLLDRGYEFSDLSAESLLITTSGESTNHVLLNPGQVHSGNGDKLKLMCQEIVTLILKLHEIDSFEIYDKMSHLPYKKTVLKITQLLNSGQFSSLVQGLDMLGFVLWGPTKELRNLQRSNNISLDCQCWLDVECAKKVNSLARSENRDSIWTYYQVKYLCETDSRKLATICDTYNPNAR